MQPGALPASCRTCASPSCARRRSSGTPPQAVEATGTPQQRASAAESEKDSTSLVTASRGRLTWRKLEKCPTRNARPPRDGAGCGRCSARSLPSSSRRRPQLNIPGWKHRPSILLGTTMQHLRHSLVSWARLRKKSETATRTSSSPRPAAARPAAPGTRTSVPWSTAQTLRGAAGDVLERTLRASSAGPSKWPWCTKSTESF
mmetsp:Transcript_113834/g.367808  ORF Transcript_113834/g.367808 Transcript_113834/m.367808 type:complete len:202 (-) Transcript_113834:3488-4093(-)